VAFDAEGRDEAEAAVAEMCHRLLANPVMETADWELRAEVDQAAGEVMR
jgi:phosphoribosylformylglycinamidine (FGAM) synthase PurS component